MLDIVPTKQQDEIIIALHENDYDVGRTIEFLLEGGDVTQDWVTAGNRGAKSAKQQSPNQTASDEAELFAVAHSNGRSKSQKGKAAGGDAGVHHSNGGQTNGRGSGARSRENRSNGGGRSGAPPSRGDRPPRRNNEFNGDNGGGDLDDKMLQLDLNNEQRPHNPDEAAYRGGGAKRGNGVGGARGGGVRSGPGRGGSNGVRANGGRGGRNGGRL